MTQISGIKNVGERFQKNITYRIIRLITGK